LDAAEEVLEDTRRDRGVEHPGGAGLSGEVTLSVAVGSRDTCVPKKGRLTVMTSEIAMTDGGIETVLVFQDAFDLPDFAAFPLVYDREGRAAMRRYHESFLDLAADRGLPYVLDTPTWRANRDWGRRLGFSSAELAAANADAVRFVSEIADGHPAVLIDGVLGPRGDGYVVSDRMDADEAASYHSDQIEALHGAGVGRITALTLNYPEEAIGIVRASIAVSVPVVPSFTVEVDGTLPDGTSLGDAITQVDDATEGASLFFMVNCAHPTHIARGLDHTVPVHRIGGLRVNASTLSHAELDEAEELDEGDPVALGRDNAALREMLPHIQVLGGCCGTDSRHVGEILTAW
jgi:S-methylmethionine-dependent homocysteine/selenocysteine methylase